MGSAQELRPIFQRRHTAPDRGECRVHDRVNGGRYVFHGGANIDTNGQNITIAQTLNAPSGLGVSAIP